MNKLITLAHKLFSRNIPTAEAIPSPHSFIFRQSRLQDGDELWFKQDDMPNFHAAPCSPGASLDTHTRETFCKNGDGLYVICPVEWLSGIVFQSPLSAVDTVTRIINQAIEDDQVARIHVFDRPVLSSLDEIKTLDEANAKFCQSLQEKGFTHAVIDMSNGGYAALREDSLDEVWKPDGTILWAKGGKPAPRPYLKIAPTIK